MRKAGIANTSTVVLKLWKQLLWAIAASMPIAGSLEMQLISQPL